MKNIILDKKSFTFFIFNFNFTIKKVKLFNKNTNYSAKQTWNMPLICFKSQATTIIPPSLAYMLLIPAVSTTKIPLG